MQNNVNEHSRRRSNANALAIRTAYQSISMQRLTWEYQDEREARLDRMSTIQRERLVRESRDERQAVSKTKN